jgi:WD40 repeat protein
MSPPDDRLKAVFDQAAELPESAGRVAFLDRECAGDAALRERVEALLRAHDAAGSFLARPPYPAAADDLEAVGPRHDAPTATWAGLTTAAGAVVGGRYKLLEPIGEGGMGTVWMAEQTEPIRRRVAVKLIKPGMDSSQVLARFEAERQALALMDHPNIAKVFDAGTTPDGRPFFVMELVKGVPITKHCDEHRLTPRERLELFVPVCQAIQHAHQKGVVHRDLKPSNVLVAPYDGKPVVKVIDFGVAKAAGQPLTEKTLFTGLGAVVGTPEYMSPEQAELNNADVDTRSDVFSLGVLLYELLTGSTPLTRKRLKQAALLEVLRLVREEEPPRPSTRLSTAEGLPSIAACRGLEPRKLSGVVRGELDWIVLKALEKDRTRRYETATGLAQDIENYLNDEPVRACPPSAAYRVTKFARKHRRLLLAATVLVSALLIGIVGSSYGLVRAVAEKRNADDARAAAETNEARAVEAGNQLRAARDELSVNLYAARSNLIQAAWESHNVARVRELLAEQRPGDGERDRRGFEWHYWDRRANAELAVGPSAPEYERARVDRRVLSPDGRRQAVVWGGGAAVGRTKVEVRDVPGGANLATFEVSVPRVGGRKPVSFPGVSFTADSEGLLVSGVFRDPAGGAASLHWWLFDAATGRELVPHHEAPCEGAVPWSLADRTLVAVPVSAAGAGKGVRLKLLTLATGAEAVACAGTVEAIHCVAFRPGGKEVAAVVTTADPERKRVVTVWDAATGRERFSRPVAASPGLVLVWSPDGRRLAYPALEPPFLRVWDTADGREVLALTGPDDLYSTVVFSPDGTRLAGVDLFAPARFVTLRDAATGRVRATWKPTEEHVYGVAFSADGTRLTTLSRFGTLRTWDATANDLPTDLPLPADATVRDALFPANIAVGGDGTRVAAAGAGKGEETAVLQVWDHAGRSVLSLARPCPPGQRPGWGAAHYVALSPDGRRAAWVYGLTGRRDGKPVTAGARLHLLDLAAGKDLWSRPLDQASDAFWFSPDGRRLATCFPSFPDGALPLQDAIRFLDVETGREEHSVTTGLEAGTGAIFTRGGDHLVALTLSHPSARVRTLRRVVWDLTDGREVASGPYPPDLAESSGLIGGTAVSRDGTRLAVSWRGFDTLDGLVRVIDLRTGGELRQFKGIDALVGAVAFSPDGTRLAAAGRSLKIWDAESGQELVTFRDPPVRVTHLGFSRDGHRLRAVAWTGSRYVLKTWDATPGR